MTAVILPPICKKFLVLRTAGLLITMFVENVTFAAYERLFYFRFHQES
jgi:hypothetical protein